MKNLTKRAGETVLEVVVALGIIAVVLVLVFSLLGNAINVGEDVERRVIAINLAREGLEVVRNVRDTNWLKYSGALRDNWLCYTETAGDCTVADRISTTEEYFIADFYDSEPLQVVAGAAPLDISAPSAGSDSFRLQEVSGHFEHNLAGTDSEFYRQLVLREETNNTCDCSGSCSDCPETRLDAEVRVQWFERGIMRSLTMNTFLYDFFDRDSY